MSVSADEYEQKMNAEAQFKMTATCRVVESKHLLATTEAFALRRPALEFEVRLSTVLYATGYDCIFPPQ